MKKIFAVFLLILLSGILAGGFWLKTNYQTGKLQEKIFEATLPDLSQLSSTSTGSSIFGKLLGTVEERFYLALFLNNTELRPGGGFIGSYGVIRVKNGKPEILKVEGTEIIDNNASGVGGVPPSPLAKYLKIKTWQFRDSNWSPDFPASAKQSLEFYRKEKGLHADKISGVIAMTPSLFVEILKITGPVKAGELTFNTQNFIETLQYESEYGYVRRNLSFDDRKQILTEFSKALLPKLFTTSFTHFSEYKELVPNMVKQKQIMVYSEIPEEQGVIVANGWGGEMKRADNDFILWADANLGALKTDASINRLLTYSIDTSYRARATMDYNHSGKFDWRTTRYLNYARVFVPAGSKLIKAETKSGKIADVMEGEENGYKWFGAFVSIEPGKTDQLSFTYELTDSIKNRIRSGEYKLLAQKQLGVENIGLTLRLNFDKKLSTAEPAEAEENFGDAVYLYSSEFKEDKEFKINL